MVFKSEHQRISWLEPRSAITVKVDVAMTCNAERDEIFFHIPSQKASRLHVMDLQILGASTSLTSPAITLEHSLAKAAIGIRVQAKPGLSWDGWIHDACGIRSKNSCR